MQLDIEKIGRFIQLRRKLMGLTQSQLGERLHVTGQSVSNWERGLLLPDTAALPDLAQILDTSVDRLLYGGDAPPQYQRRVFISDIREALKCIQRLREILGPDHFMYRTMVSALDQRMNSSIELAFSSGSAMDAYICEALIACISQGDYVDVDDVRIHITNQAAAAAVQQQITMKGMK